MEDARSWLVDMVEAADKLGVLLVQLDDETPAE